MEAEQQKPEEQDKPQEMQDRKKRMPDESNEEQDNTVGKVPEPQVEEEEKKGDQP